MNNFVGKKIICEYFVLSFLDAKQIIQVYILKKKKKSYSAQIALCTNNCLRMFVWQNVSKLFFRR